MLFQNSIHCDYTQLLEEHFNTQEYFTGTHRAANKSTMLWSI